MCVRIEVGEEVTSEERSDTETKSPASPESDREKILELIADIGSGSESMMANYQEGQVQTKSQSPAMLMLYFIFQPWFWVDTSPHKVMTV